MIGKTNTAFGAIPITLKLAFPTALAFFDLKLAPIAFYGIQIVRDALTVFQLDRLEARF